ncbi:hypothetical protein KC865_01650 [Candidatus Kaiserbacteria bacterium]|nr:hypothetical protein [Candidatus Kaiserbacteria bacterium]USN92050.1 MAG: hypothetical protein H6782_04195 [Candidatus Nomurabacteria bacterium]
MNIISRFFRRKSKKEQSPTSGGTWSADEDMSVRSVKEKDDDTGFDWLDSAGASGDGGGDGGD